MKNVLKINLPNTVLNCVLNSDDETEITLLITPLDEQLTDYKVTGALVSGDHVTSDVLESVNGEIEFTLPFSWYSSQGSFSLRLESDEGNSDYLVFSTFESLQSSDNVKVRLVDDIFYISKITSGTETGGDYNDLDNKPSINSVTLIGNKTGTQLSLINTDDTLDEATIDAIVYGGLG